MKLLLDTHIALWALSEPERLPGHVVALLRDFNNEVLVSVVSVWEVAIKHSIIRPDGSRKLGISATELLDWMRQVGFDVLPLKPEHCSGADALPWRTNPATGRAHADPFDRMLVAQALAEPLRLITADPLVALHLPDASGLIEKV